MACLCDGVLLVLVLDTLEAEKNSKRRQIQTSFSCPFTTQDKTSIRESALTTESKEYLSVH